MQNNSNNTYGNPNGTRRYFVKQRQLRSQWRRKRKAEIVSASVFSKVLSLDKLSCRQIWNIEQEKDREKKKVSGRPAKLNEKKGDRDLEREIKNRRRLFFVGRTTWKFCYDGNKMRNASGHQCKVKMSGSEKKVNENTYDISSIKRVTKKFLEVSRCSRAKQRQRNVQNK